MFEVLSNSVLNKQKMTDEEAQALKIKKEKREAENILLERQIREKLKEMRNAKEEFRNTGTFFDHSGIYPGTVANTEKLEGSFPNLFNIRNWIATCTNDEMTLSEFFGQFETERPKEDLEIIHTEKDYYKYLTRIFKAGIDFWTKGIKANLKAMAYAADQESNGNRKERKGNVAPNERFRGKQRGG